jgi:hypothetical protein
MGVLVHTTDSSSDTSQQAHLLHIPTPPSPIC